MNKIKYFDHSATTYVKEEVLREMLPYFGVEYGNPSSMYSLGRRANKAKEEARQKVANAINCRPEEIYFTACGSESDNLAIKGIAYANRYKGNHIITSKIEHPAVLNTCKTLEKEGFRVTYLNVDKDGFINLEELRNSITNTTILITIMFANNEIGTIEPIEEIGKIAKMHNIIFHTDAVQAIGNIKIDVRGLNIDSLSMSAHKFYGPKGVGALYVKKGIDFRKIQDGGHQEKDKRAGTENVAGIVGLGKAIQIADKNIDKYNEKLQYLREYLIAQIEKQIPDIKINGHRTKRLPGNVNVSFKGIDAGELLLNLDERGICASAGSACSTGNPNPSHVLTAIGLPSELSKGSLRITLGEENTKEDVNYLIKNLVEIVKNLRNNKID
ncbi:MAG: cysteine desulfurase NifS [Clostridia bacterium]|nr:cysteine desulfurase NifS [Clostridia bacterium]